MLIACDQRRSERPRRLTRQRARTVRASAMARVSRNVQLDWRVQDPIRRIGGSRRGQIDSRSL
jgi:hypothetical protein